MQFAESDLEGYFNLGEIKATGADPEKIERETIITLVTFRKLIRRPIILLPGGLTSGDHEPESLHFKGKAVDFMLGTQPPHLDFVVERMLRAGFRGIGVYWNGRLNSFHGDTRPEVEFWSGVKPIPGKGAWKYGTLISPLKTA